MSLIKCKECGAAVSKSARACPGCGAKQGVGVLGCLAAIIIFPILLIFVIVISSGGGSSSPRAATTPSSNTTAQDINWGESSAPVSGVEPYSYSIVGRRDISYLSTPRMVLEVRLDTADIPTEERMRETARLIWLPEASRWKALTVFMIFGEIEDFSSGAYGIAEFTPSGLTEFRTNDNPSTMLRLKKSGAFDGLEKPKP